LFIIWDKSTALIKLLIVIGFQSFL
jgi:hypothetical protein